MKAKDLHFIRRDLEPTHGPLYHRRRYLRLKGKTLRHMLLYRFMHQYGYDKGEVTASAIIDDILTLIEQFYRYTDHSFLKPGQMVWHAVPIDEECKKHKTMARDPTPTRGPRHDHRKRPRGLQGLNASPRDPLEKDRTLGGPSL
jgi:hypothetical protein